MNQGLTPTDARRVSGWLAEWGDTWGLPGFGDGVRVELSSRMRTSLGRCHAASGLIRLHRGLLDEPEDLLREILCHEAAHAAAYRLHGSGIRPHGPEWAALMTAAGYDPKTRMDPARLSTAFRSQNQGRLIVHRCPTCGMQREARRRQPRWRCRACVDAGRPGKLQISEAAGRSGTVVSVRTIRAFLRNSLARLGR